MIHENETFISLDIFSPISSSESCTKLLTARNK